VDNCQEPSIGFGFCSLHYQRYKKWGDPNHVERIRNKEPGDTRMNQNGYIIEYCPGHIQANEVGEALQHRRIVSDMIKRKLENYENVHHINGQRNDNRPENLELWVSKQPSGQRPKDLIEYAEWILRTYK
jgi:hypothetical protein